MSDDTLNPTSDPESVRLDEDTLRKQNWKRFGPYLAERQWGTVREDYSAHGSVWDAFTYEDAAARAYRWGEDGILGICDRQCRICFSVVLWNGNDSMLKERLFGLSNPEGNHGEDVKENYYYLESSPTHSYMKGLYKYPHAKFPYDELRAVNARRGVREGEYELADTGVFDHGRYFDVFIEYAKNAPEDILIRMTIANRGPEPAVIHVLPQLWYRNTWSWGCRTEGCGVKPRLWKGGDTRIHVDHEDFGRMHFDVASVDGATPELLFTENETNSKRLFGVENISKYVKDAFHRRVILGEADAVNPRAMGTKSAAWYRLVIPAGGSRILRARLHPAGLNVSDPLGAGFESIVEQRRVETQRHYFNKYGNMADPESEQILEQARAGLLWSKQFYHFITKDWIEGDPDQPAPPNGTRTRRNREWQHLYARDVISMPDKWEFPWFAAWDLAFHMIPFARIDPEFAKQQLLLFLREWYMHPSGQVPAYEFEFSDVNPPVHAWAVWRIYKMTAPRGGRDVGFLRRAFHKLLINFTWWVNRKDPEGRNLFAGGFLGLDNIGIFDRSRPLPTGGHLEQADGTAWMAFFCSTMLSMSIELAREDPAYEDIASKFFEHFVSITDAMNKLGGSGLFDEEDGFYYDQLRIGGGSTPLRIRSMVGLVPLIAVEVLDSKTLQSLPGFTKRMEWFLKYRPDLGNHVSWMTESKDSLHVRKLLAIPSRERLERILKYMLDEREFLSPHGIRSLSRHHLENPYRLEVANEEFRVDYNPGESQSRQFGGNSNWRGPVWFPLNYLIIEALERYHHFYGDSLQVEYPTGSGRRMNLEDIARDLSRRLISIFTKSGRGGRPCHGADERYRSDPHFRDLLLFHEHFDAETGRGLGASHQTGWTALVARLIDDYSPRRD